MKRLLLLLYVSLPLLFLSGCSASLAADRHDIERLLLIQTMGLDSEGGRVRISVSSGLGAEDAPALVMSTGASGIEDAIADLQGLSPENQLFYAHVQYLLLGQEAAEKELNHVIQWVDRSPTLRMDTNMLIVKGLAMDAVVDTSEKDTDVTQRLASLDRQARTTGWTIYTLRDVAAALSQGDGALCLAVETVNAENAVFTEDMQSDAILPTGYAVLGGDGLVEFLTPEQSMGAELLTSDPTGLLITVAGNTMEVLAGDAQVEGQFSADGTPEGITVKCTLRTGVLEKSRSGSLSPDALDAALSETAARWVSDAIQTAQDNACDFLGLKSAVLRSSKAREQWGGRWSEFFPTLPVTVSVEGRVDRSYDLAE